MSLALGIDKNPENEEAFLDLVSLMSAQGLHHELFLLLRQAHETFPSRVQTAAAYAFALVNSPIAELRNGQKALEISRVVFAESNAIEHGILVLISLSETGKCGEAIEISKKLLERADTEGKNTLSGKINSEIKRINSLTTCQ